MTSAARTEVIEADLLVLGGGTGGPMAAIKAKEKNPGLRVVLLEKANVKRSGAICMGMDGLNNAVIPGYATPEQYVKEITVANDGIVHQQAVMAYAQRSYPMIRVARSARGQVREGRFRRIQRPQGSPYGHVCAADARGHHVKKILYRQLRRLQVADHQSLHGDAPVERRRTDASPAQSASTPALANSWSCAPRR